MSTYARNMHAYGTRPVVQAAEEARVSFMKQVGLKVLASLAITAVAAAGWLAAIASAPGILTQRYVALAIMLGGIYGAQFIGNRMTASSNSGTRSAGFVIGSAMSGVALSYIVGAAVVMGASQLGNPMALIAQAGGLVLLTVLGMVVYLMSGPKEFNWLRGALSVLLLPMIGLMAITWFFPVGGTMGLIFSGVFVLVSAGSLLYSLNSVMHRMGLEQSTAGAFAISSSIVILFWNVLSLLMRMNGRD